MGRALIEYLWVYMNSSSRSKVDIGGLLRNMSKRRIERKNKRRQKNLISNVIKKIEYKNKEKIEMDIYIYIIICLIEI